MISSCSPIGRCSITYIICTWWKFIFSALSWSSSVLKLSLNYCCSCKIGTIGGNLHLPVTFMLILSMSILFLRWKKFSSYRHPWVFFYKLFNICLIKCHFVQAVIENTRAYTILKQAPFLVPFTSRVKIFTVSV